MLLKALGTVREGVINTASSIDKIAVVIKGSFELTWDGISTGAANAWNATISYFRTGAAKALKIASDALAGIGASSRAASVRAMADNLVAPLEPVVGKTEEIRKRMQRELAAIEAARKDAISASVQAPVEPPKPTPRPAAPERRNVTGDKEARTAAKKLQTEIKSVTDALEALEQRTQKAEATTLAERLAAVERQYAALGTRIAAIGGPAGAELGKRFNTALTAELGRVRSDFEKTLTDQQAGIAVAVDKAQAQLGRKDKESLDSRLAAVRAGYEATYRDIAKYRDALAANQRDTTDADGIPPSITWIRGSTP